MNYLFGSSSWIIYCLLVVAGTILLCSAILYFVRKIIHFDQLKKSHDVVGFTFGLVGVLYSVILGFTVINEQARYNALVEAVHTEAILLGDLYEDSVYFEEKDRKAIQGSLRNYIEYVLNEEWGLDEKKHIHSKARFVIKQIWDSYYDVEIKNDKMKIWYAESISKLNNFLNARLERQFNSWEHLGSIMWSLLIVGGVITISFMFLFGLESLHSHILMISLVAGYLSFMLFLVYSLDHVFVEPQKIKPTALEQVYELFNEWDKDGNNPAP